ncbi:recombination factor protein RarA, partial [sediment metagenome]
ARRMIRMATEDVGLADPRALEIAMRAAEVYERLGSPEGELALAECVVYLAVAPKSNAVYAAYGAAREFVSRDASRPVPMHLRNAPTRLMKDLGYGKGYRYAHDEEGGYAAGERYLPDGMQPPGLGTSPPTAGSRRRSARSSPGCGGATGKAQRNDRRAKYNPRLT